MLKFHSAAVIESAAIAPQNAVKTAFTQRKIGAQSVEELPKGSRLSKRNRE
jgi:hypothetical protein